MSGTLGEALPEVCDPVRTSVRRAGAVALRLRSRVPPFPGAYESPAGACALFEEGCPSFGVALCGSGRGFREDVCICFGTAVQSGAARAGSAPGEPWPGDSRCRGVAWARAESRAGRSRWGTAWSPEETGALNIA